VLLYCGMQCVPLSTRGLRSVTGCHTHGRGAAQRLDEGDDEEDAAERHREIAAAQILRRRRGDAADADDGEALEGDIARRRPDGDGEAGAAADEDEDEEALEARRAAVRERCSPATALCLLPRH